MLEALWDGAEWMTPRAVHEALAPERELSYNTVMTILVRLWRKGALERKQVGRAFAYRSILTRDERAAQRMGEILGAAGDSSVALTRFIEGLDPAQVAELRRALRRARPDR